jgi:hypothetical protein
MIYLLWASYFSSLQSVHRKPKECKERHKVLVDRSSGDGADSAEDSGSSQYYHNALPGIPKACPPTTLFCGYRLLPVCAVQLLSLKTVRCQGVV